MHFQVDTLYLQADYVFFSTSQIHKFLSMNSVLYAGRIAATGKRLLYLNNTDSRAQLKCKITLAEKILY
jgi:hypothetical protein